MFHARVRARVLRSRARRGWLGDGRRPNPSRSAAGWPPRAGLRRLVARVVPGSRLPNPKATLV